MRLPSNCHGLDSIVDAVDASSMGSGGGPISRTTTDRVMFIGNDASSETPPSTLKTMLRIIEGLEGKVDTLRLRVESSAAGGVRSRASSLRRQSLGGPRRCSRVSGGTEGRDRERTEGRDRERTDTLASIMTTARPGRPGSGPSTRRIEGLLGNVGGPRSPRKAESPKPAAGEKDDIDGGGGEEPAPVREPPSGLLKLRRAMTKLTFTRRLKGTTSQSQRLNTASIDGSMSLEHAEKETALEDGAAAPTADRGTADTAKSDREESAVQLRVPEAPVNPLQKRPSNVAACSDDPASMRTTQSDNGSASGSAPDEQDGDEEEEEEAAPTRFYPDDRFRRVWDFCFLLVLTFEIGVWCIAVIPSDGVTPALDTSAGLLAARTFCFLFWCVHLWVEAHTARLAGWEIVEDPQQVRRITLFEDGPFDIGISLPVDLILAYAGVDMWGYYLMSLRVLRCRRVGKLFGHSTPTRETSYLVESIVFGFWCTNLVILMTTLWMATATEVEQGVSGDADLYTRFIRAFYFCITTLTSVGYGDISPKTTGSRLHNIFVQSAGIGLVMLVSAKTGAYFITTDPYELLLIDRKRRLEHVMANAQVPWSIQKEAFAIYPTVLDTGTKDYQSLLNELPDFIQVKISNHIKIKLISRVPMFKGVSMKLMRHLSDVLEEVYCASKVYIIRSGEMGREMYFLNHGIVEVLIPDSNDQNYEVWAATLKAGSWFGEIALMQHTTRMASIRCVTACNLFKLNRVDFEQVLQESSELRRKLQVETERRVDASKKAQTTMRVGMALKRLRANSNVSNASDDVERGTRLQSCTSDDVADSPKSAGESPKAPKDGCSTAVAQEASSSSG
eukprot:TRINITY_DN1572_c0_g1_i1.p1 TRINITY_DN1572_c0_g1~~TRINITY_DN1572_c0_g1_i1.p1  ORF type:complete len:844 (+),score=251.10 TRINITY_DN1572_c0_g1_i1:557-3088(+)